MSFFKKVVTKIDNSSGILYLFIYLLDSGERDAMWGASGGEGDVKFILLNKKKSIEGGCGAHVESYANEKGRRGRDDGVINGNWMTQTREHMQRLGPIIYVSKAIFTCFPSYFTFSSPPITFFF